MSYISLGMTVIRRRNWKQGSCKFFLFGGGGGWRGVNKVLYGLGESSEFLGFLIPVILYITYIHTYNRDNTLLLFSNDTVMLLTFINLSRSSAPFFTFGSGSAASWTVNNNNHFENLQIRFKTDDNIISHHYKV